jgi:hypothetical protein
VVGPRREVERRANRRPAVVRFPPELDETARRRTPMNETIEVFSPVGAEVVKPSTRAPRLPTLNGKTVAETWNEDFKGDFMFPVYRELLKQRYPGIRIIPYTEFPVSPWKGSPEYQWDVARQIARLARARGADALISGNGG